MNGNLAYQDEIRDELIDGKLVAMSPRPVVNHNRIAFRIAHLFENYLEGRKCIALADGVDVHLTEKDIFVPDMMVVCEREKIKYDGVYGAPDLVVEVLSPSTAKRDKGYKKDVYEKCGVREYWLVEPVGKSIEVYLLKDGDYVLDEVYTVYPEAHLESMSEEDRAAIPTKFKCSLYDDFEITLTDVFSGLLP